jgi:hypothetical protein
MEEIMRESTLSIPELILIAGTRVALGVGIGMLAAGRLSDERRKGTGMALLIVGAITTIPLGMIIFGKSRSRTLETVAAA